MSSKIWSAFVLITAGVASGLIGCVGAQAPTAGVVEALEQLGQQGYVEALVQYSGPHQKWSGPALFGVHISAKEGQFAQITVMPDIVKSGSAPATQPEVAPRAPASVPEKKTEGDHANAGSSDSVNTSQASAMIAANITPEVTAAAAKYAQQTLGVQASAAYKAKPMSVEQAREKLAYLATEVQGEDVPTRGCLSPVRVRLVRADGSVLEKEGCRSLRGWPKTASELTAEFISAAVNGIQEPAPIQKAPSELAEGRMPASEPKAEAKIEAKN